jgi:exonuclease SbcC
MLIKAHEQVGEFHQAKSLNERFEEWETKKQKLQVLTEQLPLFEEKKCTEKAERASVIESIEQQYVELQKRSTGKTAIF